MLPKPNQPMGMMSGVGQMGFVVIDAAGTIRVQRVDIQFGQHAPQILEILRHLYCAVADYAPSRAAILPGTAGYARVREERGRWLTSAPPTRVRSAGSHAMARS